MPLCATSSAAVFATLVIAVLVLVVACSASVEQQQQQQQYARAGMTTACVPYVGSPATGGKCDHVIQPNANVFLFPPNTYADADAKAATQTVVMGAFFPPQCRTPLVALACMGSFLNCQFPDPAQPGFLVYGPCRSVCEAVVLGCSAFFESQGMLSKLPDCDMIDNSTGVPIPAFLPDGTQCLALPPDLVVPYGEVDCPYPLKYNHDQPQLTAADYDPTTMCIMPCPSPMWSDDEWTAGVTLTLAWNGISGLLSLFVAVSLCMMPGKRRFPGSLFIYIASCLAALSFFVVFFPIISGGVTRMTCTRGNPPIEVTFDNARDYDGAGVPCIIQAIGVLYLALASGLWWLALCLSVFDMVYLRRSVHLIRKWHIPYHFLAWGLPAVAVIVGFGGTAYGALSGTPWCFLIGNEWWTWSLFYIPVAIFLLIGTVTMAFSVYRFVKVRFRFMKRSGESIEQIVRLLLLLLMYWFVLLYPWGFRLYTRLVEDDIADAFEEQIKCSAASGTQCELKERINIGAWFLVLLAFGCGGVVMFLCCCSSEIIRLWWNINKIIYTKPWRQALDEIKHLIVGEGGWETRPTEASSNKGSGESRSTNQSPSGEDAEL